MTERRVRPADEVPPELLHEATDALVSLIRERIPLAWDRRDGFEVIAWPAIATGFLARGASILDTLAGLVERGRGADGYILLRVLLEHATTFCWIAIDPEPHLEEWRTWDDWRRKKLHTDALAYEVEVLTAEELAEIGNPPQPAGLPRLAEAVDKYWSEHHSAFRPDGILSFRGLYTSIYRKGSSLVHATEGGINRHSRLTDSQALILPDEQPAKPPDVPALGVVLVAFMLLVYERRFGWPSEATVRGIADSIFYKGD